MSIRIKISINIILIGLFLLCLLDMSYGYYQMVRFVGMIGFGSLAYLDQVNKNKTLLTVWIVSALLINPFIKIPLGRTIWNIVDVIWAIILFMTICSEIGFSQEKLAIKKEKDSH